MASCEERHLLTELSVEVQPLERLTMRPFADEEESRIELVEHRLDLIEQEVCDLYSGTEKVPMGS